MKRREPLTYANVMVTILAFVVLGGGTAAAVTGGNFILGKPNTASSKTSLSASIADRALRVTNPSTAAGATALGLNTASGHPPFTVNSGTKVAKLNADKLDGEDSTAFALRGAQPSQDAALNDGSGHQFCYWTNLAPGYSSAAYFRDRAGVVHLQGLVQAHDGSGDTCFVAAGADRRIFELPAGYRPGEHGIFAALSNDKAARVDVTADGDVGIEPDFPSFADAKAWVSIDGISFRCAPRGVNGCP